MVLEGDVGLGSAFENDGGDEASFRHSPMGAERLLCLKRWVSFVQIENSGGRF